MSSKDMGAYRRLLSYVKPFRLVFVLSIVAMLGYASVDALFVNLIQPLVDSGFSEPGSDVLKYAPLAVIGLLFVRGVCNFTATYGLAWIGNQVVMKMRQQLFKKMLYLPDSYFGQETSGEMLTKITFHTEQVSNAVSSAIIILVREGAFVAGLLLVMFWQSWQLSLVFLLVGPVVGYTISKVGKRFRKVAQGMQDGMSTITDSTEQMISGHKVVLACGGQEIEEKRFDKVSNKTRQLMMKMRATQAMASPVIQVIASFALAIVLYVASMPDVVEQLTAGAFASMISAMIMILQPLKKLTNVQIDFMRGIAAAEELFQVMDLASEKDEGELLFGRAQGRIEFRDVSFTYPGQSSPALKGVNFKLEPGKTLALVGRSGSGKSTITQLVSRFYNADSGQILIDGEPIEAYSLKSLRSQLALVSQQVTLFNDTISNNIAYGMKGEVTPEALVQAATNANAMEFIQELPEGLETKIGPNGGSLSGGQRQRIAIARAMLRNAPILILDEATSALDTESERYIQAALESLQQNCTSIVVAHRLSTIESADQIAVVDEGQIIEMGTHQELMDKQGAYAQLHQLQFNQTQL